MPIDQKIEDYQRRHQHQGQEIEYGEAAAPHGCRGPSSQAGPILTQRVGRARELFFEARKCRAPALAHPSFEHISQTLDLARQRHGDLLRLGKDHGHHKYRQNHGDDAAGGHDQQRRREAVQSQRGQAISKRAQEVGYGNAGNERQQNGLEQADRKDEEKRGRKPEYDLPLGTHASSPPGRKGSVPRYI